VLGRQRRDAEPLREREAGSVAELQALARGLREQRGGRQGIGVGEGLNGKLLAHGTQDLLRVAAAWTTSGPG
jgi:hypothetical protein